MLVIDIVFVEHLHVTLIKHDILNKYNRKSCTYFDSLLAFAFAFALPIDFLISYCFINSVNKS